MSRSLDRLALQKQMLETRASVQRLRIVQQVETLREGLRLPHVVRSLARSKRTRGTLMSLALVLAGGGRLGRWLRRAALLASLVGVARSALDAARAAKPGQAGPSPPT